MNEDLMPLLLRVMAWGFIALLVCGGVLVVFIRRLMAESREGKSKTSTIVALVVLVATIAITCILLVRFDGG